MKKLLRKSWAIVLAPVMAVLAPVIAVIIPIIMLAMLLTDKELARQYEYDNGGGEIDAPAAK